MKTSIRSALTAAPVALAVLAVAAGAVGPARAQDGSFDRPHDASRSFEALDRDRSGAIERDEFLAGRSRTFDIIDRDRDRQLTPDEFVNLPPELRGTPTLLTPGRDEGDVVGAPTVPLIDRRIGEFGLTDRDRSGIIEREEFDLRGERLFDALDPDRSGALDAPEFGGDFMDAEPPPTDPLEPDGGLD